MKRTIILLLALSLAGCGPSKQERAQIFGKQCAEAGFTEKQCALLFAMAEQSRDDANDAQILGAVAIGMSAGSSSRR